MSTARRAGGLLAILLSAWATEAASAQVYLRGHAEALPGTVESVTKAGVKVRGAAGEDAREAVVSWDVIRRIDGPHADEAAPFGSLADRAWRARARLERGDIDGAEPLFEELARELSGTGGPTAAAVFEGLCRCRLARGAEGAAVVAWLEWQQARAARRSGSGDAAWIGGAVRGSGLMDERTGLIPTLAPVFAGDDAAGGTTAAASLLDDLSRWRDPAAADLAMLYRAAARFEAGLEPELGETHSSEAGVRLVRDMVVSRVGAPAQRLEARKRLDEQMKDQDSDPWIEAWCRIGLGRSLVREDDADRKREGLVQMLEVPARFARVSPDLAGMAVGEAAFWSAKLGDAKGAYALKMELAKAFPRHGANGWPVVRSIAEPKPAGKDTH